MAKSAVISQTQAFGNGQVGGLLHLICSSAILQFFLSFLYAESTYELIMKLCKTRYYFSTLDLILGLTSKFSFRKPILIKCVVLPKR